MKNIQSLFCLLLWIFIQNFGYAQGYIPILKQENSWDVMGFQSSSYNPCTHSGGYRYFIDGDTLIDGRIYVKFSGYFMQSLNDPGVYCPPFAIDLSSKFNLDLFMREDSTTQRIYIFDQTSSTPSDLLWFDMSLSVGDTLNSEMQLGAQMVVDSIGTINLNSGESRRVWYFGGPSINDFFIEGIGSSQGIGNPLIEAIGAGGELYCFKQDGQIQWGNTCVNSLGLEDQTQMNRLDVYPNPAATFIEIDIPGKPSKKSVSFFQLDGKLIMKTDVDGGHSRINISGLEEGIYILELEGMGKTKLVVMR